MRSHHRILLACLTLLLAGCRAVPLTEVDVPDGRGGIVGPVPASRDVRITLETDKPEYAIGETVTIFYRVENRRSRPLWVFHGGDYRGTRPDRFIVSATHADGTPVADPFPGSTSLGGRGGSFEVKRDRPWFERFALPLYCRIERPGVYVIRAFHDLGWGPPVANDPRDVSITLTYVEPTPARINAELDAIPVGRVQSFVAGERTPWAPSFALLRDPVYLPELERRAKLGTTDAVVGISNIVTPEATEALLRLIESSPPDVAELAWICLCRRFPKPFSGYQVRVGGPGVWLDHEDFGPHVIDLWRPEWIEHTVARGRIVLREGEGRTVAHAAYMVGSFGEIADFPLLMQAFDRELARGDDSPLKTRRSVSLGYGWQDTDSYRYILGGCAAAISRGAMLPQPPATPAERVIAEVLAQLERQEKTAP